MNTEQYDWPTPHPIERRHPARRADMALVALLIVALSVLATGITVSLRASAGSGGHGQPAVAMLDTATGIDMGS